MRLDEIVAWYQKKIGTYDKEQWEKTVEQKILDGFSSSVTFKTAKLKTELIDVDLVRGSTFPKAKPKQTLITVIRLAILRYLLLPLHAQWWVKQTSPNIFALLLGLYIAQMISWALYTYNINRLEVTKVTSKDNHQLQNDTAAGIISSEAAQTEEHIISHWDLLIPMALSLLLSLIHSQIVATNTLNSVKNKRRRYSNANPNAGGSKQHHNQRDQVRRRRKKLVRLRNQESMTRLPSSTMPLASTSNASITNTVSHESIVNLTTDNQQQRAMSPANLRLDLNTTANASDNQQQQKKRNVNWHVPVQQTPPQQPTSGSESNSTSNNDAAPILSSTTASSDNASVATQQRNNSPSKSVRIADYVQDLNNDLNERSSNLNQRSTGAVPLAAQPAAPVAVAQPLLTRRTIGDDDGFESLNGKSSSGEDNHAQHLPVTAEVAGSNLRLRLNAGDSRQQQAQHSQQQNVSTDETDEEGDDADIVSSPASANISNYNECTTSATEWLGITTNSEECSYSSELDVCDEFNKQPYTDEDPNDMDFTPTTILYPHGSTDRISCTIWDHHDIKKAQMSVLEISSCIIERVESMPETNDYIYIGLCFSFILSLVPCVCRLCELSLDAEKANDISYLDIPMILWEKASFSFLILFKFAFGHTQWERTILLISFIQRLCLTMILFIIFAVAERTFKQRFLYAKLFSHLTSSRRARKSNLPHFRLNKVRNIKTWLSVRSYLKKRGPQRSVDVIVSAAFIVTLLLLAFLSVEWLKDSVHLHSHLNLEALMWSTTIGIFLLRYMTLGNKIQQKYRSVSVLITEQINLYLQIEQKPKKKDELMVSNSVLKLAADLLKELESPFKISGLSANPYLFTTVKVVILSALSGVLSEILGFKLKLHKIKIK